MVVQHNIQAMNANRMLNVTTGKQAKSTEKLSSGYRINRAADDAAGLSISEKMRKQIRGLTQASTNAEDGVSMVQTAEGALNEVHAMLQRMNELAVQSANGTNSESDRQAIQDEVDQLMTEINRVGTTTKFNETYVLKGDWSLGAEKTGFAGQIGTSVTGTNVDLQTNHTLGIYTGKQLSAVVGGTVVKGNNGTDSTVNSNDTDKYAAGFLDLSGITTKSDVEALYGTGISATCTQCSTFYSIKFVDNGADLSLNNDGYRAIGNAKGGDTLWIDISGCNNGSDVVKKVLSVYAKYNGTTYSGTGPAAYNMGGTGRTDGANLGNTNSSWHHVAVGGSGSKLALFEAIVNSTSGAGVAQPEGYVGSGGFSSGYVAKTRDLEFTSETMNLHVGADADLTNKISVELANISTEALGLRTYEYNWRDQQSHWINHADVSTELKATEAINYFGDAIQKVSEMRSRMGAIQNRLEHTINNLDNVVENTTSAESRIRDTDMAEEMVEYSKNNILAQAGQSMLAQANQANQGVLSLLG